MPNWCNNSITITGPIRTIEKLYNEAIKDADDETGLLNGMMPMPVELHDTTSPSDEDNWYDWRVSNWGTKWEVSSEGLEYTEDPDNGTAEITGWFDSAWAPPLGAFQHYIEQNPDVNITCYYEEPGMDYAGKWEDGDDQYCDDIHSKIVYYIKNGEMPDDDLFKELDEYFDLIEQRREWIEEDLEQEEA